MAIVIRYWREYWIILRISKQCRRKTDGLLPSMPDDPCGKLLLDRISAWSGKMAQSPGHLLSIPNNQILLRWLSMWQIREFKMNLILLGGYPLSFESETESLQQLNPASGKQHISMALRFLIQLSTQMRLTIVTRIPFWQRCYKFGNVKHWHSIKNPRARVNSASRIQEVKWAHDIYSQDGLHQKSLMVQGQTSNSRS